MIDAVLDRLRCPLCLAPTSRDSAAVRCQAGHSFDLARQGYVNLRVGRTRGVVGDTAEMVAARERFLAAGWYRPLADALVAQAVPVLSGTPAFSGRPGPLLVEIGAGTGYYSATVLDAYLGAVGVALDVSKYALRRAAVTHPRLGAIAVDVADRLPFADGSVALLLDVFAPRNAAEMARVLHPGGRLLVVTPGGDHLAEVAGPLGLVAVDHRKEDRLDATFAGRFDMLSRQPLTYAMRLRPDEIVDVLAMGPAGHHVDVDELRRRVAERMPDATTGTAVTASFVLSCYRLAVSW